MASAPIVILGALLVLDLVLMGLLIYRFFRVFHGIGSTIWRWISRTLSFALPIVALILVWNPLDALIKEHWVMTFVNVIIMLFVLGAPAGLLGIMLYLLGRNRARDD